MGDPAFSKDATSSSARELIFPFCDEVSKYEKIAKIGQGTFGEVFKARHHETLQYVALKKVLMDNEKEGDPEAWEPVQSADKVLLAQESFKGQINMWKSPVLPECLP